MKLSVSAYRAHSSAYKKILTNNYKSQLNYGSTAASISGGSHTAGLFDMESTNTFVPIEMLSSEGDDTTESKQGEAEANAPDSDQNTKKDEPEASNLEIRKPSQRTKSNQRWMKLRTTVQISSAIQKKPPLKREDSFLKRFSTRQIPETQETIEDTGSESAGGEHDNSGKRRNRYLRKRRTVVNPDENFYFYWLMALTICVLYNLWTLIVRQSFPELRELVPNLWFSCDGISDIVFLLDIVIQLRTGYLEQGLMVYDDKKLAFHYIRSKSFLLDLASLLPLDLLQLKLGQQPLLRFPRFFKVYRIIKFYYIVESRTVWPNLWRVVNLIHILLILAHWFGCFYFLLSEVEGFQGDWVYPYRPGDYATLSRKYLGSLYWSTLTLTTIGDLPTPETNAEFSGSADGPRSLPRRGLNSRLLRFASCFGYIFTIVSYLIGVFIFATIVGQVGNVITNRNANRLEFERLLDGAKTYMRHHKVPGDMKRRVLRWYDYSWSRGRIQGGGDINTALGLLPDKLKTELALHVNLSVLKKVTIFQECQPEFLHDLVLKMKAYIFTPGDSICRRGEVAREMFIIADGILEVLSETGKVLTTMKAGDFFGEIGILNLDGLNKRTADVRSVGYSELFSLSREDVLTAMKDYPEAQEILQTLGRKRLMEVRGINKKHAKIASEREAQAARAQGDSDNSAKNFVDKLRSDVKGIKFALRKTRTSRRSDESLEMQPLRSHHTSAGSKIKGVLRRMPRVKSGDMHGISDDPLHTKEKVPNSIGGSELPLLQRLRHFKEKQDREERGIRASHTVVSPQESIHEEPEPEKIGAGLPLLQRLLLLKAKEEKAAAAAASAQHKQQPAQQHTKDTHSSVTTTKSAIKESATSLNPSTNLLKVSFNDKTKDNDSQKQSVENGSKEQSDERIGGHKIASALTNILNKPPNNVKLKNQPERQSSESLKPWSKLKLATIVSSNSCLSRSNSEIRRSGSQQVDVSEKPTSSHTSTVTTPNEPINSNMQPISKYYDSINDLSPEYGGLPFVKKLKILNERQKLAALESVIQTRSLSLDYANTNKLMEFGEPLFRCHSDASGISSEKVIGKFESAVAAVPNLKSPKSPLSPEANETVERRQLKSILKKLTKDKTNAADNGENPQKNDGILTAPTIEGYVARHSKLMKSVTFNSTLSSPPPVNNNAQESSDNVTHSVFTPLIEEADASNDNVSLQLYSSVLQEQTESCSKYEPFPFAEPRHKGFNEQECFRDIMTGVRSVMQSYMADLQNKLQDRFLILESEVKRRGETIEQLQSVIDELKSNSRSKKRLTSTSKRRDGKSAATSETSRELFFMRGDSGDTVYSASPKSTDKRSMKIRSRKRVAERHESFNDSHEDSSDQENERKPNLLGGYQKLNFGEISDSVVVDIDNTLSSSTSSSRSCIDEASEEDHGDNQLHCDDWEIRMLAAELDRRESTRDPAGCFSDSEDHDTLLRRRRKHSVLERRETIDDFTSRPRAASLDQFNLKYSKSVCRTMSFDRDRL
ncbi:uncharacterized protein LOC119654235 isoform X4 [Hermetia illucens]|uniref:uncharacterized protein LOC119654235 isoform X4 n=1 Tax=Hermetia illucens TaxID=343691 RepID=UPI0018CC67F4|nr:uncharacterized protein LOC119654235 isoform X4 [Hermetia illucens]